MTVEELKNKREALGLSQKELAALLGVGKNTIYNYESGTKIPDSRIPILEKVLNKEIKEEITENKEKSPNDRFEDIVAKKVMELMEVRLNSIAIEFQEIFEMELAKQSMRSQKILTRLNILEENIIKETRKIKNNI